MAAVTAEKAREIIDSGIAQAQELIQDPAKADDLLIQLETKLREVPNAGNTLAGVPLMISMVRSYITKEYTEVSPKVVASLVSAFIYLIKGKDLIPDNIPLIGHLDDIAVFAGVLKFTEPELEAYRTWRAQKNAFSKEAAEEAE
ncbi:MAG: DUF1232 domain-containing protein [Solobacterium sp.]|nr:DUF1232 domain-containing protein [Solobacterium sp.]